MEYDAITAGVDPGGINNSQQVRLLVCYMLRSVKDPIDRALLPELIQYYSLANYFEVMQAIDELVDKGSLLLGENGELTLSDKGRSAIDEWEFILPLTVKEKAARAAVTALTKLRTDRENKVDITPEGNGFSVKCRVLDGDRSLLEITLWVPDKAQAEAVKKSFFADPLKVYGGVIALLTAQDGEKN